MPSPRTLSSLLRRALGALDRPPAAVLLEADNVLVRTPGRDVVWACGSDRTVAWWVVGPAGDLVDIELVTVQGAHSRTVAALATDVATGDLRATVRVPDVAPGTYRVLVTSVTGALDAYSPPVTLVTG